MSLVDRLREILERGGDWQRIPVKCLPGVTSSEDRALTLSLCEALSGSEDGNVFDRL
jgi:hypothetical protein